MLHVHKLRRTAIINVLAGATARGWVNLKPCQHLQTNSSSPISITHILSSLFELRILTHPFLLSIIFVFNISHGNKPTYPYSSHRNAAFETSSWSRRLNHLHSRQRCPHWVRCWLNRLSLVSTWTSPPKSIHPFSSFCSWRDRGKQTLPEPLSESDTPEAQQLLSLPPPPYQQGQWQPAVATVKVTPPTPVQASPRSVRKSRHLQVASARRPITYHRKSRSRAQASSPPFPVTPTPNFPTQPEFNFGYNQENQVEQTPLEDQVGLSLSS